VIGPRIKVLGLIVLSAGMIAALSGCDASENADLANGRLLFTQQCGTCHQLKEAGGGNDLGPDLDAAFAAARAAGEDQDTIEGVVAAQIEHPREVDPADPTYMPADLVEGQDVEDVSAYVASVAGVPGIEAPQVPGGPGGQIFASSGCSACHTLSAVESAGNVGPNLDEELPGQSIEQIQTSIVDPGAEIVSGFPDVMPKDYEQSLEPADLKTLVQFLADSAGQGAPPSSGGSPSSTNGGGGGGTGGSGSSGGSKGASK